MNRKFFVAFVVLLFASAAVAFAGGIDSGGNLPWESQLEVIQESLTGPVPRIIGIIMIAIGGLIVAFTEGQGVKRLMWVLIGVGIALNAMNILDSAMFQGASAQLVANHIRDVLLLAGHGLGVG